MRTLQEVPDADLLMMVASAVDSVVEVDTKGKVHDRSREALSEMAARMGARGLCVAFMQRELQQIARAERERDVREVAQAALDQLEKVVGGRIHGEAPADLREMLPVELEALVARSFFGHPGVLEEVGRRLFAETYSESSKALDRLSRVDEQSATAMMLMRLQWLGRTFPELRDTTREIVARLRAKEDASPRQTDLFQTTPATAPEMKWRFPGDPSAPDTRMSIPPLVAGEGDLSDGNG